MLKPSQLAIRSPGVGNAPYLTSIFMAEPMTQHLPHRYERCKVERASPQRGRVPVDWLFSLLFLDRLVQKLVLFRYIDPVPSPYRKIA
jgi:hypothetical protein